MDADRLSELQDAQEKNQILTKQFQELQVCIFALSEIVFDIIY